MTLEKAMVDLSIQLEVKRRIGSDYQAEAIKLGIEALNREKQHRQNPGYFRGSLLPTETKE